MPIQFRSFDAAQDLGVLARLWTLDNPDWPMSGVELGRKDSQRAPEYAWDYHVGELDGTPVCGYGFGDQSWAHRPGRKYTAWYLDPAHREEALSAIYEESVRRLEGESGDELNMWCRDDQPADMKLFEDRGFELIERQPVSRLLLDELREDEFAAAGERVASDALRIASVAQLEAEGFDWIPELYDASWTMLQDIPMAQAPTRPDIEEFRKWVGDRDLYQRQNMYTVMDGERIAGYTRLISSDLDPNLLFTGLTGVRPEYRRRGIATAVKVRSLVAARSNGAKVVQTDNLETNPMLDLNIRLGFRPRFAFLHYVKSFAK